jgi:hypothetical protein
VQRVKLGVAVLNRKLGRLRQHLVGASAEQACDVNGTPGLGRALSLQVPGEKFVERTTAGANGTGE